MRINPILLFKPQVNNVENNKQNYPLYANTQLAADTVEFEIEDNRFICDVLLYMNLKG